ncbi:MAG: hypothetical protein RLZZ399_1868 [Verrucomicrobiota bacterium]|jgi:hypothetical protein
MPQTGELTFFWRREPWLSASLLKSVSISTLVHLLVFLIFKIDPSDKSTSPSPAPEILVLSDKIPEHRPLLDWLQSESPTGALAHRLLPPSEHARVAYRDFFQAAPLPVRTPPRWIPPAPLPFPKFLPPAPIAPSSASYFPGNLVLSPELLRRLGPKEPVPSTPLRQILLPVSFLVGVRDRGEVAFLTLKRSSGEESADSVAEAYLRKLQFEPSSTPVEWGTITLYWPTPSTALKQP